MDIRSVKTIENARDYLISKGYDLENITEEDYSRALSSSYTELRLLQWVDLGDLTDEQRKWGKNYLQSQNAIFDDKGNFIGMKASGLPEEYAEDEEFDKPAIQEYWHQRRLQRQNEQKGSER